MSGRRRSLRHPGSLLLLALLLAPSGLGAQSPPPVPPPPPPGSVRVAPVGAAVAEASELEKLRREVEALRRTQEAMRRDLAEIRRLLGGRPEAAGAAVAPKTVLDVAGLPGRGDARARLVVIEFSDYQCPFCARSAREAVPELERTYVADGRVRYVFADHPLKNHPHAAKAAEAVHCAGEQGKLWEMHDLLFSQQKDLAAERLPAHAGTLGLDGPSFEACLASGRHAETLQRALAQAEAGGVTATPTFLVGWAEPGGSKVTVVERLRGAQPFARLQQVLDALLAQPPSGP